MPEPTLEDYFGSEDRPKPKPKAKPKEAPAEKPKKLPPEPWRSRKPPSVTDHYGHEISRVGYASLVRAMDNMTDTPPKKQPDWAMVYCEGLGISLSRDGSQIRSAKFTLCSCYPSHTITLQGAEGRDNLIARFLTIWRKRKSFAWPAVMCEIEEAPRAEYPKREKLSRPKRRST